jgi:DNA-binding MarR family transcriptional regulator
MSTLVPSTGCELAAWRELLRTHASLVKTLDREMDQAHDLSLSSYEVLLFLGSAEGSRMRMCDLADSVLLSRSGLTRLIDRLERGGLVVRDSCEQDARGAYAVLTDAGLAKLAAARDTHLAGVHAHFLDRFSAEELELLSTLLERVGGDSVCPERACGA